MNLLDVDFKSGCRYRFHEALFFHRYLPYGGILIFATLGLIPFTFIIPLS